MNINDCFFLGKVGRPKSYKGQVHIIFDNDTPELYTDIEEVYLLIGKKLISYPLESFLVKPNGQGIAKFEGINTDKDADRIKNLEIYLPNELLPELDEDDFYLHDLVGCMVSDQKLGEIGIVREVNDQTAQRLLMIGEETDEIIIPLIDEFIIKVDKNSKTIETNLPEGLIDLNE